ncbi:hypothetical protein ACRRTK_023560 [Alexandromys fortis]
MDSAMYPLYTNAITVVVSVRGEATSRERKPEHRTQMGQACYLPLDSTSLLDPTTSSIPHKDHAPKLGRTSKV